MGYSNVIAPFIARGLRLLGLAIPLTTLALITIMVVQAYNEMTDLDFGASPQIVSTSFEIETGRLPQSWSLSR